MFQRVFHVWAEPEEVAEYPSAVVLAATPGTYDASRFVPQHPRADMRIPPPDGRWLIATSELLVDLTVEVWATDPLERMALVSGLEDALCPHDYQYGLRLELPHYHGLRGTYEPTTVDYLDSETDAIRRYRRAAVTVRAQVSVVRLATYPGAIPRAKVDVVE